jgi:hypothetical protein
MQKRDEKEFFRLWYEFARRHEVFKDYLKHHHPCPEKFRTAGFKRAWGRGITKCGGLGFFFIAAQGIAFDVWWEFSADKMRRWAGSAADPLNPQIEKPAQFVKHCLNLVDVYCKNKGIKPSADELKELLLDVSRHYFPNRLIVNLEAGPVGDIVKGLKSQATEMRLGESYKKGMKAAGRVRYSELEKALEAWDLKESGLNWRELIEQSKHSTSKERISSAETETQSKFRDMVKRAKAISKGCMERGQFPIYPDK